MKIKQKLADQIKQWLEKAVHLRDSDTKLIATIWHSEIKRLGLNPETATAMELLELFVNKKLSNPESIRRSRCKLQEIYPELRGLAFIKRHKNQTNIINQLSLIR